jgi:hypothetical protein
MGIQNPLKLIGFLPCHKWQGFLSNRVKRKMLSRREKRSKLKKPPY